MLGGTGKTGRRVVERLRRAACPTRRRLALRRAAVRLGGPHDVGAGAARRRARCTSSFYPDLALPGARRHGRGVRRAGRRARGPPAGAAVRPRRGGGAGERAAVQAAGADCTIVRVQLVLPELQRELHARRVLGGEVALPVGDVPEPFVDVEDIADVAVAALTEDGHAGRALRADRAAAADVRGRGRRDRRRDRPRRCAFVPVPIEEYRRR